MSHCFPREFICGSEGWIAGEPVRVAFEQQGRWEVAGFSANSILVRRRAESLERTAWDRPQLAKRCEDMSTGFCVVEGASRGSMLLASIS